MSTTPFWMAYAFFYIEISIWMTDSVLTIHSIPHQVHRRVLINMLDIANIEKNETKKKKYVEQSNCKN